MWGSRRGSRSPRDLVSLHPWVEHSGRYSPCGSQGPRGWDPVIRSGASVGKYQGSLNPPKFPSLLTPKDDLPNKLHPALLSRGESRLRQMPAVGLHLPATAHPSSLPASLSCPCWRGLQASKKPYLRKSHCDSGLSGQPSTHTGLQHQFPPLAARDRADSSPLTLGCPR